MEGLQFLITAPGILIYNSLPMNISAIGFCTQVGRDKIALMLWVGEKLLFFFLIVGLEEDREMALFMFVLCFMSR